MASHPHGWWRRQLPVPRLLKLSASNFQNHYLWDSWEEGVEEKGLCQELFRSWTSSPQIILVVISKVLNASGVAPPKRPTQWLPPTSLSSPLPLYWSSSQFSLGAQATSPNSLPILDSALFGCVDFSTQNSADPYPSSLWMSRHCRHHKRDVVIFSRQIWTWTHALGKFWDSFSNSSLKALVWIWISWTFFSSSGRVPQGSLDNFICTHFTRVILVIGSQSRKIWEIKKNSCFGFRQIKYFP